MVQVVVDPVDTALCHVLQGLLGCLGLGPQIGEDVKKATPGKFTW